MKINKTIIVLLKIIGSLLILMSLSTIFYFKNEAAFAIIATFLSITTGFTITALSIIATSKLSKELYEIESQKDNSKTLLHELIESFKKATLLFILTIGLILIYNFFPCIELFSFSTYEITTEVILKSLIWYCTFISFYDFYKLFSVFSKFIIKSCMDR